MRFFDTNVLIYAATDQDMRKRQIARELLQHALEVNQLYRGMVAVNPFKDVSR